MRRSVTTLVSRYQGLAMLLFLAATGGGLPLAWTIIASDVRRRIR